MIKSIVVLVILSVIAVLGAPYIHHVLNLLLLAEKIVASWLSDIFARTTTGIFLAKTITLAIIPIVISLIVLGILTVLKKKNMQITEYVMWIIWIILFTVLVH